MKWAFLVLLAMLVPALSSWMSGRPRHEPKVWMVMGFLPFVIEPWHLSVAPLFYWWLGYVKGFEVSLLDGLALAVLLSRPRSRGKLPFQLTLSAYVLVILLSALHAPVPRMTLCYAWQIGRMWLVFAAIARVCEDERGPKALITGLAVGLSYQFAYAMDGRFLHGMSQSGGTFGHQNMLGMASHLVVFPALALLLAGDRGWPSKLGLGSGLGTQIVTASRATIGFAGIGYAALFLFSSMRGWTPRKAALAGLGLLAIAGAVPLATASLDSRFGDKVDIKFDKSGDEREIMEKGAWLMIADHPWGIGANQFANLANVGGYWDRVDLGIPSRKANVHNAYLLTIAELGYVGAIPFFLLLASALWLCFRSGFGNRGDPRAEVLLGVGVALGIVCLHSFYEFGLLGHQIQYLLFTDMGLAAGLVRQLAQPPAAKKGSAMAANRRARAQSDLPALPGSKAAPGRLPGRA